MSITSTISHAPRRTLRMAGVVAAPVVALLIWAVAGPLAGIELQAPAGGGAARPVGPVAVVVAALLAGLAAWGLRALLDRFSAGRTMWLVIAEVTLLVSLLGPLGAATLPAKIVLAAMHVAVAATLAVALAPSRA